MTSIQRWGGRAGIAGSLLFVVVFAIVAIFAGAEPPGTAGPISRFPEIRIARIVENGLYLAVMMLWVPLSLALHHQLRLTHPARALFGSALNILGLAILAAGAIPHAVTMGLSDRYHAAGVTLADQQTLALQWHATQDMFEALLLTGLLIMPVGVILLGSALRSTVSVILGVIGLGAAIVMLVDPDSLAAVLSVFALIGFHFIAGWKVNHVTPRGPASP